ncbi:protein phosphatase regulatory subunit [Coprinopsis cinerea okayama7|uniref:Protein phosphatase regulatory subunit n=1 Tax=Coprinopsis cinerea (strain Okayama-7 / 130 / ATCC MYA-4618 / FGSC 9003) TaxID=240176 RepID=A8NTU5_COPC7|nr:protein phosphatase regulatory subunit [Coprinopsis cinerea okayama7\|eukprot:XP_001836305.2 protein phosphatase regulatory subunit [Coprinopsis cinerea okayama7\
MAETEKQTDVAVVQDEPTTEPTSHKQAISKETQCRRSVMVDAPAADSEEPSEASQLMKSQAMTRVVQSSSTNNAESDDEKDSDVEEQEEEAEEGDFLADFPDETDELELVHCRLGSLDELRLRRFANHLRRLCLRQNLVKHLDSETFHQLTKLQELDLYDNRIKNLGDALDKLSDLTMLDLSFNLFKHIPDRLEHLSKLTLIYFVQNRISKITGLESLTNLTSLELGGNRIRKIENLDTLVNLEELWLGKNKITKLEGLSSLKKLRILSIQSNRITKLEGVEGLESLEELYLSHNGIKKIENLEKNTNLTTLDIGYNFLEAIEGVSHLNKLEELWISGNKIPDFSGLDKELRGIKTLRTLYLEANPCETNDRVHYRRKVMLALPQLTQIDATYVRL